MKIYRRFNKYKRVNSYESNYDPRIDTLSLNPFEDKSNDDYIFDEFDTIEDYTEEQIKEIMSIISY